jgi:hypothetical protein
MWRSNPSIDRTAQKVRFWVPYALRPPGAGYFKSYV